MERLPTNNNCDSKGYMLEIKISFSTLRKGLLVSTGYIDNDYCGNEDEISTSKFIILLICPVSVEKRRETRSGSFVKVDVIGGI